MADSARTAMSGPITVGELSCARVSAIPWYVWSATLAVTSTTIGLYWDISWHSGIGRDTFWTPAHLSIQLGAVLTGISYAVFCLKKKNASDRVAKENYVMIWGF